jgi:hypothetical protein
MLAAILYIIGGTTGCLIPRDPLPALWFYTYSDGPASGRDTSLTPASFLVLRSDGSYTRDFGRFEYGTWTRKDKELSLVDQDHVTHHYTLDGVNAKEMRLTSVRGITADFERLSLPAAQQAEDPFCVANNRWRLPARQKEPDSEIRKRLFNHCQFWEAYFTWALNDKLTTVDVRSTPTPIKIYGNGFGLKPFDQLPAEWKSCFFDEEDCRKASDIIENIFQQKNIAWAHTDNKFKLFLGAFQQMENFLR